MRRRPVLRARSPVAGLNRRALGPLGVFAQSVATTAPAGAMAATPVLVAADAGRGAPWSFAVAAVLIGLVVACIAVFARRMAAAGSLYSFTAKGLGPGGAYACAVAMVVGYGLLVAAALSGVSWYGVALVTRLWPGLGSGPALGAVIVVAVAVAIAVLARRGVRLAGRVMLVVECVSIGLILVVLGAVALAAPSAPPAPDPTDLAPGGFVGIAAGVLPALAAFIGVDSGASLAVEARRPFATVPRAVAVTAGVAAVLYLVATVVQLSAPGALPGAAGDPPGVPPVPDGDLAWASLLVDAGIIASFLACSLAALNTLVRVLFSLARDGVAPGALGRTHRRHRTPAVAVAVAVPVVAAGPLIGVLAGIAPRSVFSGVLAVATLAFLVAYLLVCLAAPRFLARIGELTPGVVAAAMVAVSALLAVAAFAVLGADGPGLGLVLAGLVVAGGLGWVALRRVRPAALEGMGVYDETTTGDVHQGILR